LLFLLMLCQLVMGYASAAHTPVHAQPYAYAYATLADIETLSDDEPLASHRCHLCAVSAQLACAVTSACSIALPPEANRQPCAVRLIQSRDYPPVLAFRSRAPPY
jgi:hypothetical protein